MYLRIIAFTCFLLGFTYRAQCQGCCSGGSGSPVAGGISQGVLSAGQAELGMNFQYVNSKKFLTGDKRAMDFLSDYYSSYLYSRVAYGVTDRLTMSVESGYYFTKTQVAINKKDKESSGGIADLILFPRYKCYEHNTEKTRDEITVGLGYKIPVGKYLDSTVVYTDPTGKNYFTPKPPAVMPASGSNDFLFYGFAFRGYPQKKFRIFTSMLYIHKGWNALGEKFGDYASIGFFAGKTVLRKLGITLQLKGEWIDKMDYDHNVDMLARYNIDVNSFGSRKVSVVPQLNYEFKPFSCFIMSEFPLYQYVNGTAIASQYLVTCGFTFRFFK